MAIEYIKCGRLGRRNDPRGGAWDIDSKQEAADTFAAVYRDPLRNGLDSANWQVTDVVAWDGAYSSRIGVCFLVRHISDGAPTGPEWLFGATAYNYNGDMFDTPDEGWGDSNRYLLDNYFWNMQDGSGFSTSVTDQGMFIAYAPDGFPGFEFDASGTVTTGDGDAPAPSAGVTPYSDLDVFMPASSSFKGFVTGFMTADSSSFTSWAIIADPDNPSLTMFFSHCELFSNRPTYVVFGGDNLIEPYDPTDTDKHAWGGFMAHHDTDSTPYNEIGRKLQVFDSSGTRHTVSFRGNYEIQGANSPRSSDGKYVWEPTAATSGGVHKGYLNPKFLREVGGQDQNMGRLFSDDAGDVYYKFHRHYVIRYPKDTMPWPYAMDLDGDD
jgi:hypothetical protein